MTKDYETFQASVLSVLAEESLNGTIIVEML